MSSKFERKRIKGGIQAVKERVSEPGSVDVGIIDAGQHESGDMTVAAIGFVHEFGANINHPGGTPYKILGNGRAIFLKKGDPTATGITQPHKITIPERSFMRSTIKEKKAELVRLQVRLWKKIINGVMGEEKGLGLLGEFLADKIKRKIVAIKEPPNAPATLRKKAPRSNPLIDTGQLKNSITYEVNK